MIINKNTLVAVLLFPNNARDKKIHVYAHDVVKHNETINEQKVFEYCHTGLGEPEVIIAPCILYLKGESKYLDDYLDLDSARDNLTTEDDGKEEKN